jgi:hypothetical protein
MLEDLEEPKTIPLVVGDENSILAKKQPIQTKTKAGGKGVSLTPLEDSQRGEASIIPTSSGIESEEEENIPLPVKRPKGRPRKPVDKEAEEFKKRVAEETEKAYREVIESKIKSNIKKEMRKKAIEEEERFKDPEPKEEKPKRVLSEKQKESLNKGREIAISRTKNKRDINKKIDEEVKTIKEAKKNIRKTLLVDKIREQIDGLDSDEDEEEIVIQKKPKAKKIPKQVDEEPPPGGTKSPPYPPTASGFAPPPKPTPKITFY